MMRRTSPMVSKGNNKMYIYIAIAIFVLVAIGVTLWLTLGNDKEEGFGNDCQSARERLKQAGCKKVGDCRMVGNTCLCTCLDLGPLMF